MSDSFKVGDKVKFKTTYGWGGSNPDFYGEITKKGKELVIEGSDFEPIEVNSEYVKDIRKA